MKKFGKIYLFHHSDNDGFVSGTIMKQWINNTCEYEDMIIQWMNYNYDLEELLPVDELNEDSVIIFVDYSFSAVSHQKHMERCLKKTKNILIIDHHESSKKLLSDPTSFIHEVKGVIDTRRSAAMLCYIFVKKISSLHRALLKDYYNMNNTNIKLMFKFDSINEIAWPNDFMECIDSWDRFYKPCGEEYFENNIRKFQLGADFSKGTNDIILNNLVEYTLGFKRDAGLSMTYKRHMMNINNTGAIILNYENTQSKFLLSKAFECTINGVKCIALNREGPSTIFMDKYDEYDIVIPFIFDGEMWKYSLFSNKKVNCLPIAEKMGGGGHKYACGFRTRDLILYKDAELTI